MEKYLSDVSKIDTMERSFETTIVSFVKKGLTNDQITFLDNLLKQSNKASHSERFVAFFTLFSLYRREVNNEAIKELFSKYRQDFVDEPLFTHIDLLRLTMISHSKDDLKHIMEKSKKYIHDLEHSLGEGKLQHTGILHFYASAVCSYYEVSDYNYR